MRPYSDLLAWQKAHALVIAVYRVTREYPPEERFGLVSQTRRAAASVPANLAEACGKRSFAQLRHGADIASGSLSELEYWLLLARDLGCLTPERHDALYRQLDEVRRLVHGFAEWAARAADRKDEAEDDEENEVIPAEEGGDACEAGVPPLEFR